jgi:hypothetical protein
VLEGLLQSLETLSSSAYPVAARLISCALPHVVTAAAVEALYQLATSAITVQATHVPLVG